MHDLRYAWRVLTKNPGFSIVIVLTLALGIGANTAVFSIVNGVLLRPLPYAEADRLVMILQRSTTNPLLSKAFGTYADYKEYAAHTQTLERLAGIRWAGGGAILSGRGQAKGVVLNLVTEEFFSLLGAPAAIGRTFEHDDMLRGCSVVISDSFWRGTLGSESHVVGQSLILNRKPCAVIGVMPASFAFYPHETQVWQLVNDEETERAGRVLMVGVARLKRGVTPSQAEADLAPLHKSIHSADWERDTTPVVDPVREEFLFLAGRNLRATLWVLLGAVAAVLLIACVNVANLLLGRMVARERELAIRAALGSGRLRLVQQLLTEGLLLASIGGALGILAGYGALRYFRHVNPIELPIGAEISLNLPVLAFTALLSIATALVFGIGPALTASRRDVQLALRGAGRGSVAGSNSMGRFLIAAEMALSLALLAAGALLIRSVVNMSAAPLGFDPTNVMVVGVTLPQDRYQTTARQLDFYQELLRRVQAIPGVEEAAISNGPPPYASGNYKFEVESQTAKNIDDTGNTAVTPRYFRAMRIPLRRGRVFDEHDRAGSELVGVVNEALVSEYFSGRDPIGARVRAIGDQPEPWVTVIGVVANEKKPELLREMSWHEQPVLYRPFAQDPQKSAPLVVRIAGVAGTARAIDQTIADLDIDIPTGMHPMLTELLATYLKYPRFRAIVTGAFASLALLLAAIGLYGLVAQLVVQRTKEIGIRMAVGARATDVLWLIVRQGGGPVLTGLAVGIGLTGAIARSLQALLYGIKPDDPITLAGVSVTLLAAALIAIVIPARRAVRVDPMIAVRNES